MKIDGKKVAGEIIEKLKKEKKPGKILAVIKVGENPASESFIKIKKKTAEELGVDFRVYEFAKDISGGKLREEAGRIGKQGAVGGVIVQLPLPLKFNRQKILNAIPEEKDADVLSEKAWGKFVLARSKVTPPAVGVIWEILNEVGWFKNDTNIRIHANNTNNKLWEKSVAVVGAGFLVGKPVAEYFTGKVKKLTVFDKRSELKELKDYDLVVTGVGKGGIIKPEFLKEEAGVIDFGYDGGKGDLEASDESKLGKLAFFTPTPGGTGPILVAKLFENFYKLAGDEK